MAAAIILIPEMLSGPQRRQNAPAAPAGRGDAAAIKTYTIDLGASPGAQVSAGAIDERAPPPEEASSAQSVAPPPALSSQAKPEDAQERAPIDATRASSAATGQPDSLEPAQSDGAKTVVEPPTPSSPAPAAQASRPLGSPAAAPISGEWAVQLGSFSKESTAHRLAGQLRVQGHAAFVMPVKSSSGTLYRVRIGPLKDKAGAEAVLREVKPSAPGAAVVIHP